MRFGNVMKQNKSFKRKCTSYFNWTPRRRNLEIFTKQISTFMENKVVVEEEVPLTLQRQLQPQNREQQRQSK